MSDEELKAELERLKKENEKLKQSGSSVKKDITFKVSQKGAVSVYGMGRFPVTLYKEQWLRLLDKKDDLIDFISEHDSELATKN